MERKGRGERMHIGMLTVFVGGDTVETGAAVTVQSLSKGDCTARVTRLGLADSSSDQGRPGLVTNRHFCTQVYEGVYISNLQF